MLEIDFMAHFTSAPSFAQFFIILVNFWPKLWQVACGMSVPSYSRLCLGQGNEGGPAHEGSSQRAQKIPRMAFHVAVRSLCLSTGDSDIGGPQYGSGGPVLDTIYLFAIQESISSQNEKWQLGLPGSALWC